MAVKVKIVSGKLIIEADIDPSPKPSGSGKTLILSTTGGNLKTDAQVEHGGQKYNVVVGLNAYIPNPDYKKPA